MVLAVVLMVGVSQFYRSCLGVIAPELAHDLAATPRLLGLASAAFFGAFVVAQVPVGIALDRVGPRRLVNTLTIVAVLGAVAQALAPSGMLFVLGRFVLGLGCSASVMASVVLCARWFSSHRLTTALSRVFALSQVGIFVASSPLAWTSERLGWRDALLASAGLTALVGVCWHFLVRDAPPGTPVPDGRAESLAQALREQFEIWCTRGLLPILALHGVGYAAAATVVGLWAGPYLADVHGLDAAARGWVLLAMGVALPSGLLVVGPLERMLNTRKWLAAPAAGLSICMLLALAGPQHPGRPLSVALLIGLCLSSCYPVVLVAHSRSLFPDRLLGRGLTTVNLAQVLGAAALPALTGLAIGAFPVSQTGARPEVAYRAAFAILAGALSLGLGAYMFARDVRPRQEPAQPQEA